VLLLFRSSRRRAGELGCHLINVHFSSIRVNNFVTHDTFASHNYPRIRFFPAIHWRAKSHPDVFRTKHLQVRWLFLRRFRDEKSAHFTDTGNAGVTSFLAARVRPSPRRPQSRSRPPAPSRAASRGWTSPVSRLQRQARLPAQFVVMPCSSNQSVRTGLREPLHYRRWSRKNHFSGPFTW
jgi:hypothetical protein